MLKINDLRYKDIIKGCSFELDGHIYALVGPNGAGKSTIASIIMGLDGYREIEGDIIFNGESIKEMSVDERAAKGITLAWQEPARFEGITVRRYLSVSGNPEEVIDKVGLSKEYLDRKIDTKLSGGERKRVELASVMLMKPKIALLDELDSGIDIGSINKIFDAIDYLKEQGTTVILITHSQEVLKRAEYGYLICHGEIIDQGPTDKVGKYFTEKCKKCREWNE